MPIVDAVDPADGTSVKAYIDEHLAAYQKAMRTVGGGQDVAGVGTILSALVGTTALALGAGPAIGIVSGSVGAGLNATNGYARPGDRLQLLGQAMNATSCIREEFSSQIARRNSLGRDTAKLEFINSPQITGLQTFIMTNGHLLHQLDDAGEIAIDATRTVATNLQVKWANVSKVPDYAATVRAIQDAQSLADANKPPASTSGAAAALVAQVAEYEKNIEDCKSKFPA